MKGFWLGLIVVVAAAGVGLYFVHPLAPLFLLASLLVQAPIIWLITRTNLSSGYLERARARREQYEKTGDAAAWLAGEEAEARGIGYRYWSRKGQALNTLAQAEALYALGQKEAARQMAVKLDEAALPKQAQQRRQTLL